MGILLQDEKWSRELRDALPALIPLGLVGVWRWGMFLFRVIGWYLYKPQPPSANDSFSTNDVTLIIPTIDTDEEAMHEAMRSWVLNEPHEILIVTVGATLQKDLQAIAKTSIAADITRVLTVAAPANKRIQLVAGIKAANTDLVCFTDDDAIWNANFLKWLLVPFNDDKMGGTGSSQIMRPNDLTKPPTVYERIADMRLSGRMLEACASTFYDGSVSCLSGRTALYHKRILTDNFAQEFTGELWLNKYPLISGDDKFMTRWIVKHNWKMSMQVSPECTLATTFKADGKFFMQILRWTRNTWRSDCKSLVIERDIWYRYPVQAVLMVDRMISPFTLMLGPILFILSLVMVRELNSWDEYITAICIYILWVLASRTLRIVPHIYRCPEDFTYLVYFITYQYYFAVLKLYALFTLHVTAWGTREGVAGGVKQARPDIITEEVVQERRVQMKKKKKAYQKTYQRGNIALMRRIHTQRANIDQDLENLTRDQLHRHNFSMYAGSIHNGTTIAGSQHNGQSMYNGGSMYNPTAMQPGFMHPSMYAASLAGTQYHGGSVVAPSVAGAQSMGPGGGAPSIVSNTP